MSTSSTTTQSPLTGTSNVSIVETLDPTDLIDRWEAAFDIDISSDLAGLQEIRRYRCNDSYLEFYTPPEAAGGGGLYEALQQFDWYYMPNKWEHQIAAQDIREGDSVLEVGCGDGAFVEWISDEKPVDAKGIELNEDAAESAQSMGRKVTNEDLFDLAQDHQGSYDVVCSFQVLEHIYDVKAFIEASLQLLQPEGRLLFGVPNCGGFIQHANNDLLNQPPHHMTRWSPQAVRFLPQILPVTVKHIEFEPLAKYHVDWYVGIHLQRLPKKRIFQTPGYRLAHHLIKPLLKNTKVNRLLSGHTMYACLEKASSL
jgi:SAM-dependent methyltransferase